MKRSIVSNVLFTYMILMSVLVLIICSVILVTLKFYFIRVVEDQLKQTTQIVALQVKPFVQNNDYSKMQMMVDEWRAITNLRYTVISAHGHVLADSHVSTDTLERVDDQQEFQKAYDGKVVSVQRSSQTLLKPMIYVAVPIKKESETIGVMRVSLFLSDVMVIVAMVRKHLLCVVCLLLLCFYILAFLIMRYNFRALLRLTWLIKNSSDALYTNDDHRNDKELSVISRELDRLTQTIRDKDNDLHQHQEDFQHLIASMTESFCVLDTDGKAVIYNPSFERLFEAVLPQSYYWGFVRNLEFRNFVHKTFEQKQNDVTELIVDDRDLLCSTSYIEGRGEVILMIRDMTPIRQLEQLKKDFVVNVSHELKTPLTAIMGFTETLLSEETEPEKRHYIEIVERHAKRLNRIVADLLTLSELEQIEDILEKESVDVHVMITRLVPLFEKTAESKGLELCIEMADDLPVIFADRFKLEQVLVNLIDNALAYTQKGCVKIKASCDGACVQLIVEDTGVGIAEEDLARIFERFYTVDQSHSRQKGGTGLGLSIVKHILSLHGATIEVLSQRGRGTSFIILFPV